MRIMLDTNILISMFVFKSMGRVIEKITEHHTIVLCSYVIEELREVVGKKFPSKEKALDDFLSRLPFELVYTPAFADDNGLFEIRDPDDEKVLYSAVISDVDILLTGDKDFADIDIERPEILTPADFLKRY